MKHFSAYTAEELATDDLFVRWVQHPDDAEVASFWEGWLLYHPNRRDTVETARQLVRIASQPDREVLAGDEVRSLWGRIRTSIQEMPELQPLQPDVQSFVARWYFFRSVGAAAGIVLFLGWMLWTQWSQAMQTFRTSYGTSQTVTLPDGSVVTLNGNSELRFARVWSDEMPRAVWLKGEAFFSVAHRPIGRGERHFRVHTDKLTVEVEGTQFNVSDRQEATRGVLSSGKIRLMLNGQDQVIDMKPGESVEVKKEAQPDKPALVRRQQVDPKEETAWKEHRLVFNETSLADVARLMSETYGLTLQFQEPQLADIRITGTVPSEDVDVLLMALARTSDLTVNRNGSVVTVAPDANR